MKAVVLSSKKRLNYMDVEDISIKTPEEVIIRVQSAGLCGSDMHRINSEQDPKAHLETLVLGHEISGDVFEIGHRVKNVVVGNRVTILPLFYDDRNNTNYPLTITGSIGKSRQGGFAEYIAVPERNVFRISDNISYDEAALVDLTAVAVHAYNLSERPNNKKVMIIGDGSIGLSCAQIYKHFSNEVHILGKHNKLLVANMSGHFNYHASEEILEPNTYDIIIEAVGREQSRTVNQAIQLTKPRGRLIVEGVFPERYNAEINIREALYKEISIQGANSYLRGEFIEALSLIENRDIHMDEIITHRFALSEFSRGIFAMNNKSQSHAVKVIYKPKNE